MPRFRSIRRGYVATYYMRCGSRVWGVTIWRRGAISFLAPIGDGVPLQIVIGDWWEARPNA